jgi:hypothetical protein
LSLGRWSSRLPTGFRVSRSTHGPKRSQLPTAYGTVTRSGRPFQQRSAEQLVAHSVAGLPTRPLGRSTPDWHRRQPVPPAGFGLLPVRSPLLRESFLFLEVLRCFSSPGSLRRPIDSAAGDPASPGPGCPIRRPSDHSLPAAPRGVSSPGHVLHRPQTPRHPPCALHTDRRGPAPGPRRSPARRTVSQYRCLDFFCSLVKVRRLWIFRVQDVALARISTSPTEV